MPNASPNYRLRYVGWGVVVFHAMLLVYLSTTFTDSYTVLYLALAILASSILGLIARLGPLCLAPSLAFFLGLFWIKLSYTHGLGERGFRDWAWAAGVTAIGLIVGIVLEWRNASAASLNGVTTRPSSSLPDVSPQSESQPPS